MGDNTAFRCDVFLESMVSSKYVKFVFFMVFAAKIHIKFETTKKILQKIFCFW